MSIDLPDSLERDLERYAQSEHITPAQAAEKFILSGLKASKRKSAQAQRLTEAEWRQLRETPIVAFFERLPDEVLKQMESASKQIHSERFTPRG